MEHKSFHAGLKSADADGTATWVMATLGVIDHDGDVTLPGAFGKQTVTVLPSHQSGHVPLGKGVIYEDGDEAIAEVKFNLAIPAARDWHEAIKFDLANPPALQEYSYGYDLKQGGYYFGELDGQKVRFFKALDDGSPGVEVLETSPVLRGAGLGTRTLAAKAAGLKFGEHVEAVVADVDALIARATDVVALRAEKGKAIAEPSAEALARLDGSLKRLAVLLAPAPDTTADEIAREYARFVALTQGAHV